VQLDAMTVEYTCVNELGPAGGELHPRARTEEAAIAQTALRTACLIAATL
jgi:hypothetical protein